tara:strand:- start:916 stop:2433 length:1518 start_codon:yes stop_codon:yes gene_type:complete
MKIAIVTYYTSVSPYKEKWEEQMRTWVPQAKKLGIPVYSLKAEENLISKKKYVQKDDFIIFKGKTKFTTKYRDQIDKWDITLSKAMDALLQFAKDQELDYILSVDNDCFVEPSRFLNLIKSYLLNPDIDYAGHCMPYLGWYPLDYPKQHVPLTEKPLHFASGGAGILLSKKAINIASIYYEKELLSFPQESKWCNDYILASTLRKHNIPLYQDGRFWISFPGKEEYVGNPNNNPLPYIGDINSQLVCQHEADGHMDKIANELGYNKINLIFSTSRRFNLFEDTIKTLIKFNPNLNTFINKVYILDDKSSEEDRTKLRTLTSNYFPNKTHLVTFDNNTPFGYVEKFNFIKLIASETEYSLFLEEDWRSIASLNLEDHLNYLDTHPEIDQLILSEHFWLQDEDVKEKTSINETYWNHTKVNLFKHTYDFNVGDNGVTYYTWMLGKPIFTFNPTLNRNSLYSKGTFKLIRDYEHDFSNQVNAKQILTKQASFVHTGADNSAEGTQWRK